MTYTNEQFQASIATSEGYHAGFNGRPRDQHYGKNHERCTYTGDLLVAWNIGFDRGANSVRALGIPKMEKNSEASDGSMQLLQGSGQGSAVTSVSGNVAGSAAVDQGGVVRDGGEGRDVVPVRTDSTEQPADGPRDEVRSGDERSGGSGTPVPGGSQAIVIVDLMNILVRSFHASEKSLINGVRVMFETLGNVIDRLNPEYMVFALDGGHVERTALYPDYKAHRPPKDPELEYQIPLAIQALSALGWPTIRVYGWEADDVIASFVTDDIDRYCAECGMTPEESNRYRLAQGVERNIAIVSSDKDLLQLLGRDRGLRIYHPWNGGNHVRWNDVLLKFGVTPAQIGDYLAMVGDTSDGVPGVKGIGPAKATTLLLDHGSLDAILQAAANSQVPGAMGKNLVEHAACARMCRKLVTLRTDLPIGSLWRDWPLRTPRAGWQERLRELGLGAVASKLAGRIPDGVANESPSHIDVELSSGSEPGPVEVVRTPVSATTESKNSLF